MFKKKINTTTAVEQRRNTVKTSDGKKKYARERDVEKILLCRYAGGGAVFSRVAIFSPATSVIYRPRPSLSSR